MQNTEHMPAKDCPLCPRLATFRDTNRTTHPTFFNGAVPAFGSLEAPLLVVGLAPGLKGANATGRPFTGDYAGDVLYESLLKCGLAKGSYARRADDGLALVNCRITNAVRCVPPENKPETAEIKACNPFLRNEIAAMPNLRVILTLGGIAHKAVLTALGYKQSAYKFAHGAEVVLEKWQVARGKGQEEEREKGKGKKKQILPSLRGGSQSRRGNPAVWAEPLDCFVANAPRNDELTLLNSYHCSRYNINTNRLTQQMFDDVVARGVALLQGYSEFE